MTNKAMTCQETALVNQMGSFTTMRKEMSWIQPRKLALGLCLVLFFQVSPAEANMSGGAFPGSRAGEPFGAVSSLAIESEELVIDLRPLEAQKPAQVSASYLVYNPGPAVEIPLVFVSPMQILPDEVRVEVNGGKVPSRAVEDVQADGWKGPSVIPGPFGGPASGFPISSDELLQLVGTLPNGALRTDRWKGPSVTPGLFGGPEQEFSALDDGLLQFVAKLPSGQSAIRVQYAAAARRHDKKDDPYRWWQFAYVFSPSRDWGSFGELQVQVDVPHNWHVASSLPLDRVGDRLTHRCQGIPSDSLGLTLRPRGMSDLPARVLSYGVVVLGFWLVVATTGRLGRLLARRGLSIGWGVMIVPVAATIAAAIAVLAVLVPAGSQSSRHWFNGYEVLFLRVPFVWLVSLIGGGVWLSRSYREHNQAKPGAERLHA